LVGQRQELATSIAIAYAIAGDRDQALTYLNKALDEHDQELVLSIRCPAFDFLRGDPRYAELMQNLGLPE
jgi:hypothetical protein